MRSGRRFVIMAHVETAEVSALLSLVRCKFRQLSLQASGKKNGLLLNNAQSVDAAVEMPFRKGSLKCTCRRTTCLCVPLGQEITKQDKIV